METPEQRRKALHEWQRHYNMVPRNDSRLTERYVAGEIPWPPDMVAKELVATDFLYKYTLYGELIEDFFKSLAGLVRSTYNIPWSSAYNLVREYGPIALKLQMTIHCAIAIPERLPTPPPSPQTLPFNASIEGPCAATRTTLSARPSAENDETPQGDGLETHPDELLPR